MPGPVMEEDWVYYTAQVAALTDERDKLIALNKDMLAALKDVVGSEPDRWTTKIYAIIAKAEKSWSSDCCCNDFGSCAAHQAEAEGEA
jgi:hypothetical protein